MPIRSSSLQKTVTAPDLEYRELLEALPDSIVIVDDQGTIVFLNSAVEELFGYRRAELLGRRVELLVPERQRTAHARKRTGYAAHPHTRQMGTGQQLFGRRKDGSEFPADISLGPVMTEAGLLVVSTIRDISERQQAQETLQRSQALLAETQEIAHLGSWERDLRTDQVRWSDQLYRIFGLEPQKFEATFEAFLKCLHPDDRELARTTIERALCDGKSYRFHCRAVRPDGTERIIQIRGKLVMDEHGKPVRAVGTGQDVTEQRQVEEALQRAAFVVQWSGDAILATDLGGRILSCNPGVERVFGWRADELTGQHVSILIPAEIPGEQSELSARVTAGEQIVGYETVRIRKDGRRFDASLTVSPLKNADGRIIGTSGIARDITQRTQLEAQLRHVEKMEATGRMAAAVAHEFNNLLTVISGYSELLLEALRVADPRHGEAEQIKEATARASSLVRQLLAFAKKTESTRQIMDLNSLVRDSASMLRPVTARIQLEITTSDKPCLVEADPEQMRQVVTNLVINACDAMSDGGRLTIYVAVVDLPESHVEEGMSFAGGRYGLLAVSDTGCGMDAETQKRIFEPFFTTKKNGTGLGLSTVYGIVRQSNGHTVVQSLPGEGTTFKIYFPLAERHEG